MKLECIHKIRKRKKLLYVYSRKGKEWFAQVCLCELSAHRVKYPTPWGEHAKKKPGHALWLAWYIWLRIKNIYYIGKKCYWTSFR